MLRLLTRGSRMRELYLQYLKHSTDNEKNPSTVKEVIESMRQLVTSSSSQKGSSSLSSLKSKLKRYRKAYRDMDSIDPSGA